MRRGLRLFAPLALAAAAALASRAGAETVDTRATALGWQAEQAEVVVRARLVASEAAGESVRRARFSVVETLKGDVSSGDEIPLVMADGGHGYPWKRGHDHLLFLTRVAPESAEFRAVGAALGVRTLPAKGKGPELEFPGIVRRHLAAFDAAGVLARPAELRALLVELVAHDDPGIAGSAALDLVRHRSLHAGLSGPQRDRILDAYREHPSGKSSKHALAEALAVAGPSGALEALVDSIAAPAGRPLRGSVADALERLGDARTTAVLVQHLDGAEPVVAESLLHALGAVGKRTALPVVRRRLLDDDPGVRVQAAHAFGRIARAIRDAHRVARAETPGLELEPIEGREDVLGFVIRSRTKNEWRAGSWALAQLDQQAAYENLRELARDDPRPDVRRYAERYLDRPRLSLVLR